jgi:hypothetical protein
MGIHHTTRHRVRRICEVFGVLQYPAAETSAGHEGQVQNCRKKFFFT